MQKTEERQSNPQQEGEQGPALARLTFILPCIPVPNFILIPSGHLQHSFQPQFVIRKLQLPVVALPLTCGLHKPPDGFITTLAKSKQHFQKM